MKCENDKLVMIPRGNPAPACDRDAKFVCGMFTALCGQHARGYMRTTVQWRRDRGDHQTRPTIECIVNHDTMRAEGEE